MCLIGRCGKIEAWEDPSIKRVLPGVRLNSRSLIWDFRLVQLHA